MKVDFGRQLEDLDGAPLLRANGKDTDAVPMTLGWLVSNALLAPVQGPEPAEHKIALYDLAKLVYNGGVHELTAEHIVLAKKKVNDQYGPAIVGQALRMLEGSAEA